MNETISFIFLYMEKKKVWHVYLHLELRRDMWLQVVTQPNLNQGI